METRRMVGKGKEKKRTLGQGGVGGLGAKEV
jgi:hypothetical protein